MHIKKGLNIPLGGIPEQIISGEVMPEKIAVLGDDFIGMKPLMLVEIGDHVKIGTPLFVCKKTTGVSYTSPAAGRVVEINRGEKRFLDSVVIAVSDQEDEISYSFFKNEDILKLDRIKVVSGLLESGLWTSFRTRPFSKVPDPATSPASIFITATDTNPLAPCPEVLIQKYEMEFKNGVEIVSKLTKGETYLCLGENSKIEFSANSNIKIKKFGGVHPAGNVGTHIHFVDPVGRNKTVWHINYQDVIAISKLFSEGKLWTERIISVAGPGVKTPSLIKTRMGASINEIIKERLIEDGDYRVVSGSLLNGREVLENVSYLGRYHHQISVFSEGSKRSFLGWGMPGKNRFSIKNIFLARFIPNFKVEFNTFLHGGERAIIPIGSYEKVMPLDILPTQLIMSMASKDVEQAERLGILELDEEDLALCTFVCPGKIDVGGLLRQNLDLIEKEG